MTRKRYDEHSTEFGLWLREQEEIDSKKGYVAINLDYIWRNYKTKEWMLIEEKRYKAELTFAQKQTFYAVHSVVRDDPNYKGFYFVQFEKTNPKDGKIWIWGHEVTELELMDFLKFKNPEQYKG